MNKDVTNKSKTSLGKGVSNILGKRNDQESTPVQPVNNPVQEPYNPDVVTVEPAKNEDIFNAKFIRAVYRYKACDLDELSLYEGIWLTIFVSALLSSRVKVE